MTMENVETRAVGGGSPASSSSDSSEPLPHPPNADGGCSLTFNSTCTQTDISIAHDANFWTNFSAKTCSELLPNLTTDQLDFELRYQDKVLRRNLDLKLTRNTSKAAKVEALSKVANSCLASELNDIFYDCESYSALISDFMSGQ